MTQKVLFWFFIIVLAFLPGGIFISVFLLALYYLVPLFFEKNSKKIQIKIVKRKVDTFEFKGITFSIKTELENYQLDTTKMKSYSDNTLEEMK